MQNQQKIGSAIKKYHIRFDLEIIASLVKEKSKILDIGCGEGDLLKFLQKTKKINGKGLEISQTEASIAMSKGISVIQGDAENDLAYFPDNAFDYAILSQTLQATKEPDKLIAQMLRIAKYAIISFPNFAHFKNRLYLSVFGKMPVSKTIPYNWYDTPNIHFCSIQDFRNLCAKLGLSIRESIYLNNYKKLGKFTSNKILSNLFAEYGIFLITKNEINMADEFEFSKEAERELFSKKSANTILANDKI